MIPEEMNGINKFLVGVNYWPRRKAMYWWKEFDEGEARDEFGEIRDMNLHVVRIFLDWEEFQPAPEKIDINALRNLKKVLDIGERYKLKIIPTFFCGFMSGISLLPEWSLDKKAKFYRHPTLTKGKLIDYPIKNLFENETILDAQKLQVKVITSEFSDHPAIYAWDISNEVENLAMPRSHEVAKKWLQSLVEEIKRVDNHHPITGGFHQENLEAEVVTNWISDAGEILDLLCMHGYPNYSKIVIDPVNPDFVPFCNLLTQSLGKKSVLFEEFGLPTVPPGETSKYIEMKKSTSGTTNTYLASEGEAAEFYRNTLEGLRRVGSLGALAWCFSDYDRSLWEKSPFDKCIHERFFGITRTDGSVKPAGNVLREFTNKKILPAPNLFEITPKYYKDPLTHFKALWSSFRKEGYKRRLEIKA